ncbi:glycoside hydrolase family 127 protein [Gracilibacillus salitolerans]|uniref:Glycoside hydrolase family 127 protein n=1 Tax=Gracilibacillus salitolerans TaxID=2663022 RepID=A0A5Q2TJP0_9BACI|nr:beta-L-arabinofuranosidase domain-containing protein [Gracilibacillus salitolerans]QGH34297.1 glycoside hydrolase family 127 protein [Gracilibacillus salitolerans]
MKVNAETIPLKHVKITDDFWKRKIDLAKDVIIPYQWDALNDNIPGAAPSHAIENFRIAAGLSDGEFKGMVFQDSDVAKWLEAASYSLIYKYDPELEKTMDEVIELIGQSQLEDGYLNTYFTVKEPEKRWKDICHGHELYCAGHMIEAAVAFYEATRKDSLLKIVSKYVDYIITIIGAEERKLKTYPGHPELELALVKLYEVTGENKYFDLMVYFIEERGKQPSVFLKESSLGLANNDKWFHLDYHQAHARLDEQDTAEGHAVRAVYLYAGMADLAKYTNSEKWKKRLEILWGNVVEKRMYVTGGIGSQGHGERFTLDYDLPNNVAYAETCASIGLVFWAQRMLQIEAKQTYGDVMEKALYNGVLSGMSLDGKKYFYVNPLEMNPEVTEYRHDHQHVESERVGWFGCACCPPNIARLLTSLGNYIYTQKENTIYTHLYVGNQTSFQINDQEVMLTQKTDYPWSGEVSMSLQLDKSDIFTLAFRQPAWSNHIRVMINGTKVKLDTIKDGYIYLSQQWKDRDEVTIEFDMSVHIVRSNPKVRENAGKVALQRGPIIYCLEEVDNGSNLHAMKINPREQVTVINSSLDLESVPVIKGTGVRESASFGLYMFDQEPEEDIIEWQAIPYSYWGNRGKGEMLVWLREN